MVFEDGVFDGAALNNSDGCSVGDNALGVSDGTKVADDDGNIVGTCDG